MGRVFMVELEGNIYVCQHCKTHLCIYQDLISKDFQCKYGRRGYFFSNVVNFWTGEKEDKLMMTGLYTVVDIYCIGCGLELGWRYEVAHETNQKYKEGKFVLELCQISGPHDSNTLLSDADVHELSSISLS